MQPHQMRPRGRRDEAGLTLIEVIIAASIMGIVLAGLAATTINTLNLSRSNANRVVAANIAAGEIERIRALPFETLDDRVDEGDTTGPEYLGEHSRDVEVDGQRFTLTRTIEWSTLEAESGVCTATVGPADDNILAVSVEVSWFQMFGTRPVRSDTTISPPIGAYARSTGTLAVQVVDDSVTPQIGIADALVTVTGPDPLTNQVGGTPSLSDGDGCVVLTGLNSGTYTVEVEKIGYRDLSGNRPTVIQPVTVEVRSRTDQRVELYPTGYLAITIDARVDDVVPDGLPRYATPSDGPTVRIGDYDEGTDTWTSGDAITREVAVGDYTVYVGICGRGDYLSDPATVVAGPAAAAVAAPAQLASVDVDWMPGTPETTAPFDLTASRIGTCDDGDDRVLELGAVTPGVPTSVALPWTGAEASWRLQAVDPVTGQVLDTVDVDGDGSHRPSLISGGLGDWRADPGLVPTVFLELPEEIVVCTPVEPSVVGNSSRVFGSFAFGSAGTQTIDVPGGTNADDLLVVSMSSPNTSSLNWAPTDPAWDLVAEDARVSVWVRPAAGAGSTVSFTRPAWFFSAGHYGIVQLVALRGITDPGPSVVRTGSSGGSGANEFNAPSETIPPDEFGVLYRTVAVDADRSSGQFSPGPQTHDRFSASGGHSRGSYWSIVPAGPTGAATLSWSAPPAPASGHQIVFEAASCAP